jgi:hypothetical protein
MVRTLGRSFAAVVIVLSLASCFFTQSAFSPLLTQVLARADLSATIPAGAGSQYQAYIVTPSGGEFVILLNTVGSTDPAAVILDSNLRLIQTYTQAQFTAWSIAAGSSLMTDAAGNVALKDHYFRASDLTTINQAPSGAMPAGIAISGASFSSPAALDNDINFQVAGGNLNYAQYTSVWANNPGAVPVLGVGNYNVVAAYDVDDTPAAGEVLLVLNDSSNSTYLVAVPLLNIQSQTMAPGNILSNYPSTTLSNVASWSIGFAGDSLVVYNYSSNSLIRYSVKPPFSQLGSLAVGNLGNNLQYVYRTSGGYSVQYNQTARSLTKVANWW